MKRWYWMAGLLLTTLPACGDPSGSGGIEATYQLVAVNMQPLPYNDLNGCCIFTGGSLTLGASDYSVTIIIQNKSNGMAGGLGEEGTYSLNGSALLFQRTGGNFLMHLYNAVVDGRTIRLQLGGDGPGALDQYATAFRR